MDQAFRDDMTQGYGLNEPALILGSPMLDGELDNDARVQVALSMMNRHGLIAGATGTGKTKTLQLLASDEGKPILADYGGMSPAWVGVLLRSLVVLEQEGADPFFGDPDFEVPALPRTPADGFGIISVLELRDVMDKPSLFSTFM